DRLGGWLEELGREAASAVEAEGIAPEEIEVRRRLLNLRFAGQEAFLAVEHQEDGAIEEAFAAAYQEVYGYAPEGRAIELESVRVVASSRSSESGAPPAAPRPFEAAPAGELQGVPFFDRAQLSPGASFAGPALVFERHSATVVAEGWRGKVDGAGNLVLRLK
ncbi:MAG TPA: 5-oxoprolinase, partial [Thermoanaerobaculia bacterium]|nr:5-oxoprolinase [Thermoanaerobaculia bacterium]